MTDHLNVAHAELQGWPEGHFLSMLRPGVRAIWHVWAAEDRGQPMLEVLVTPDEGKARALLKALRDDDIDCRLDVTIIKRRSNKEKRQ